VRVGDRTSPPSMVDGAFLATSLLTAFALPLIVGVVMASPLSFTSVRTAVCFSSRNVAAVCSRAAAPKGARAEGPLHMLEWNGVCVCDRASDIPIYKYLYLYLWELAIYRYL
jgi:hypothetical protein